MTNPAKALLRGLAAAILSVGLMAGTAHDAEAGKGKYVAGAIIGGLALGALAHQYGRHGYYYGPYGPPYPRHRPYVRYNRYDHYDRYGDEYCYRGPRECHYRRECWHNRYGERRCKKRRHCYRPLYCE